MKNYLMLIICSFSLLSASVNAANDKAQSPVEKRRLAADLLKTQTKGQEDPLILATAAILLKDFEKAVLEGFEGTDQTDVKLVNKSTALFAKAKKLAGANNPLQGIIEQYESTQLRGAVQKARAAFSTVKGHDTNQTTIRFKGDEWAGVHIWGDGSSDLKLRVLDSKKNIVCEDMGLFDMKYCQWYPKENEKYHIRVTNIDDADNTYELVTN